MGFDANLVIIYAMLKLIRLFWFNVHSLWGFQFISTKNQNGKFTVGDQPPLMAKLKAFREMYTEDEIKGFLGDQGSDFSDEIDFEGFLRVS